MFSVCVCTQVLCMFTYGAVSVFDSDILAESDSWPVLSLISASTSVAVLTERWVDECGVSTGGVVALKTIYYCFSSK